MFPKKPSGAKNRKCKAKQEKDIQKQAGSFLKYLESSSSSAKEQKIDETLSTTPELDQAEASTSALPMEITKPNVDMEEQLTHDSTQLDEPLPQDSNEAPYADATGISIFNDNDIGYWKLPLSHK